MHLTGYGPINPITGYPQYYRDANGVVLELCRYEEGNEAGHLAVFRAFFSLILRK